MVSGDFEYVMPLQAALLLSPGMALGWAIVGSRKCLKVLYAKLCLGVSCAL